mmetsp:Transcript_2531/g.7797  ORF Transcript_2531/g.7797 Transcript_2531/m.7797 type:complete len:226 (-) Transcript_2531:133-810(-)
MDAVRRLARAAGVDRLISGNLGSSRVIWVISAARVAAASLLRRYAAAAAACSRKRWSMWWAARLAAGSNASPWTSSAHRATNVSYTRLAGDGSSAVSSAATAAASAPPAASAVRRAACANASPPAAPRCCSSSGSAASMLTSSTPPSHDASGSPSPRTSSRAEHGRSGEPSLTASETVSAQSRRGATSHAGPTARIAGSMRASRQPDGARTVASALGTGGSAATR